MSEELKLFAGSAVLVIIFALISIFVPSFQTAAINGLSALLGAVTMYMKGKA